MEVMENSSLIFMIAILLALTIPDFALAIQNLIIPALVVSMTLSMRQVRVSKTGVKNIKKDIVLVFLMNYLILSGIIILLAHFLVHEAEYFQGFIIMAAVPPAIAVVPFTRLLKGDLNISVMGEIATYLASIFLTPLIILFFMGKGMDAIILFKTMIILIFIPFIVSRPLGKVNSWLFKWEKIIINLCFALISYTIIALNRSIILDLSHTLTVVGIIFLRTFVIGSIVYIILSRMLSNPKKVISYTLFASYKNGGLTAALALMFLNSKAALPAALSAIFELLFFVYFKWVVDEMQNMR